MFDVNVYGHLMSVMDCYRRTLHRRKQGRKIHKKLCGKLPKAGVGEEQMKKIN